MDIVGIKRFLNKDEDKTLDELIKEIADIMPNIVALSGGREKITASKEFTVPEGVYLIEILGCAAGGGGAGSSTRNSYQAGSGGECFWVLLAVSPGEKISFTIGTKGKGGQVNLAGTDGGNTVIAGVATFIGGKGGKTGVLEPNPSVGEGSGYGGYDSGYVSVDGKDTYGGDGLYGKSVGYVFDSNLVKISNATGGGSLGDSGVIVREGSSYKIYSSGYGAGGSTGGNVIGHQFGVDGGDGYAEVRWGLYIGKGLIKEKP